MDQPALWPDRRILDLFGIDIPIIQAPMANASTPQMALAVSAAGDRRASVAPKKAASRWMIVSYLAVVVPILVVCGILPATSRTSRPGSTAMSR